VNIKTCGLAVTLFICLSVGANAARAANNSDYGVNGGTTTCFDVLSNGTFSSAVTCPGDVETQAFTASTNDAVYVYEITDISNFTLTLNSSVPFIDFGEFACDTHSSTTILCSHAVTVNGNPQPSPASTVVFDGTGNDPKDPFVFFAVQCTASSFSTCTSPGPATVTATITRETSTVPEPRFLPLFGFGLLAAFVLYRRWQVTQ
jgi:hypothetical protein